jgi:hypothetical protein
MTDELERIVDLATKQLEGGYSAESDAMSALHLVIELAHEIAKLREAAGLA